MMRIASLGVVLGALAVTAGCSTAPETSSGPAVAKPSALAKVTASPRTRKLSGVPTWQVYNGYGHVAALGFDKKGKPVDGLRIVYADASGPVKGIRFETVRHRGVLAFDAQGNVVENTLSYADLRTVYGGYRAIHAVAKSGSGSGSTKARAFRAFADDCSASDYLGAAANCWKQGGCIATGVAAGVATGGAAGLAAAGTCLRSIDVASHLACGSSAYKVGSCLYDKVKGALSKESQAKNSADQKADKEASLPKSDEPKEDPERPDGETPKDPSCADDNDPACGTSDPTSQDPTAGDPSCTDDSDPSCGADPTSPEDSCAADDPDCSANVPPEEEETASDPAEEPDASTELDPNPGDPDETASTQDDPPPEEPADSTPPPPEQNDTVEASLRGGVHVAAFAPSTSKAVAKRIGGACRASQVLQCGVRKGSAFCRCVKL